MIKTELQNTKHQCEKMPKYMEYELGYTDVHLTTLNSKGEVAGTTLVNSKKCIGCGLGFYDREGVK